MYIESLHWKKPIFQERNFESLDEKTRVELIKFLNEELEIDNEIYAFANAMCLEKNLRIYINWLIKLKKFFI